MRVHNKFFSILLILSLLFGQCFPQQAQAATLSELAGELAGHSFDAMISKLDDLGYNTEDLKFGRKVVSAIRAAALRFVPTVQNGFFSELSNLAGDKLIEYLKHIEDVGSKYKTDGDVEVLASDIKKESLLLNDELKTGYGYYILYPDMSPTALKFDVDFAPRLNNVGGDSGESHVRLFQIVQDAINSDFALYIAYRNHSSSSSSGDNVAYFNVSDDFGYLYEDESRHELSLYSTKDVLLQKFNEFNFNYATDSADKYSTITFYHDPAHTRLLSEQIGSQYYYTVRRFVYVGKSVRVYTDRASARQDLDVFHDIEGSDQSYVGTVDPDSFTKNYVINKKLIDNDWNQYTKEVHQEITNNIKNVTTTSGRQDAVDKTIKKKLDKILDSLDEIEDDLTTTNKRLNKVIARLDSILEILDDGGKLDAIIELLEKNNTYQESILNSLTDIQDTLQDQSALQFLQVRVQQTASTAKERFPTSIPWDLYAVMAMLVCEPEAPVFTIPVSVQSLGLQEEITIDLSGGAWASLAKNCRRLSSVLFVLFLIDLTRKMFFLKGDGSS